MVTMESLQQLEERLSSGAFAEEFEHAPEERRHELLDFLEKLMDVGELADEVASKVIFKDSLLGMMMGGAKSDGGQ